MSLSTTNSKFHPTSGKIRKNDYPRRTKYFYCTCIQLPIIGNQTYIVLMYPLCETLF